VIRRAILVLVVFLASLLGAAQADLFRKSGPSTVVFPKQKLPLSFSHAEHLSRDKLNCAYCHDEAADSKRSADLLTPPEATCATCHEIDRKNPTKQVPPGKPDAKCDSCHPGWNGVGEPPRLVIAAPNLKFNHQVHVSRQIRCQSCHGDLQTQQVGLATRDQLPRMPLCLKCHDGKQAPSKCTTCHVSEPGGFVKTQFPQGALAPSGVLRGDAHDPKFRTEHSRVAGNDERYCANCHAREFCVGCHDGVVKPLDFHGGDYVSQHPIDARRNNPDCGACHRRQTFCAGCHARSGLTTDTRLSEFDRFENVGVPRDAFHPNGWFTGFDRQSRSASHHSFQAQRNLRACASCHEEEFCITCHGRGSAESPVGVNPHPAGWARSAKCKALAKKAGRMCLRCHGGATGVAVLGCD
jgi:c(7)-type cytochrome triheme protein